MAHIRQPRPDNVFRVNVRNPFQAVPSSPGSGSEHHTQDPKPKTLAAPPPSSRQPQTLHKNVTPQTPNHPPLRQGSRTRAPPLRRWAPRPSKPTQWFTPNPNPSNAKFGARNASLDTGTRNPKPESRISKSETHSFGALGTPTFEAHSIVYPKTRTAKPRHEN